MKIRIITPAPPRSRKGNRVTALRWARILRALGHHVEIEQQYQGGWCDLLVALHARRSFASIRHFRCEHPQLPLIVALTGTDVYQDLRTSPLARQSLEMATRLIVLQPLAIAEIPERVRPKARVIYQSAEPIRRRAAPAKSTFDVCVLGHLRPVKDPFRTALAARLLPASSRLQVLQVGAALSQEMAERARTEAACNPRYRWLGELPRWRARHTLARSRLLVLTSKLEGGANVVSEALAAAVPVLSSRIPGSVGILGEEYPGYFPFGEARLLAALLHRAETDTGFYEELRAWCQRLAPLIDPARERQSWESLLRELSPREARPGQPQLRGAGPSCPLPGFPTSP
ncbi:MAG: TIGR04348 family glycosyltransferase [Armatimonadetes bacterium]|nr:TIGR04348 family glycosyltransferase [Armatimonadota bacterium]